MEGNQLLTRQLRAAGRNIIPGLAFALVTPYAVAARPDAPVSTVNHAFATELGTGFYDIGGRSVFIATFTPAWEVREASSVQSGTRLILPLSAGSFNFVPDDAIEGHLPDRIDTFSIAPGVELDFLLHKDWLFTPWVRAGASFAGGTSDGFVYGAGARLIRDITSGDRGITQLHDLMLVNVSYRNLPDDSFLRLRNAVDLRQRTSLRLGAEHQLLAGLYGILDVIPDPPAAPAGVKPSSLQLELGFTLNADPRPQLRWLNWPRLGIGYRFAGDFSGWRIVIGAPF